MSINFNHLKTFCSALIQKMKSFRGNWNQNDPTADDYIKNRPFYSEVKKQTITLVDNLTSDTDFAYWPECTFIPGQSYDVTYNGVLYPNLVCYRKGGCNIICEDVPCHIDDDGGNSLYIDSNDDSWIISITTVEENEIIHKLDKKFINLPKGIVTEDSLENTLENNLAPVAFTNSYDSLDNKPAIYTDVVRYGIDQWLTDSQKGRARFNIDVYSKNEVSANYMQMKDATITMPFKASWESVAYGNGRFVAVAYDSSNAAYSEDGITWKTSTLPSGSWRSVTYGNGKFVAVAYDSSNAAYSEDGITWQASTLPLNYWYSVTYGNGKFVAVGSNKAAYSEDGIVWHEGSAITTSVGAIAYGNGKFVAISTSNGRISYSEDGVIWHESTPPIRTAWRSIAYGDGKFVILANASGVMLYSEDGITWTSSTIPAEEYQSVIYGNGKFVAAADTNKIYYSIDGIAWSAYDLPSYALWQSVAYGNGKFVVVASGPSNKAAYSEDGITWTDKYKIPTQNGVTITPEQLGFNKTYLTGYATEEYVVEHITGAKDSIVLNDSVTGFEYVVQVQNGNLVSSLKCTGIEITTMPDKVEYTDGENFDPTGMVVVATYPDGSTKEIIDYTYYSDILTKDMNGIEISYTEAGFTYTNIAHISVNPFDAAKALIDFYYTDNKNGTYTITGWKQTLNGESSTELIVPSNPSIIV